MNTTRALLGLVLFTTTVTPARAADLAPLLPDKTWMVLGVEVKGVRESPLGKKLFGQDNRLTAFRKLLGAFAYEDGAARLKRLKPLEKSLNGITRITATFPEGGDFRTSDDTAIFVEGDFDDAEVATGIEACCKQAEVSYKTEKIGERTVHVAAGEAAVRTVRLDKTTVAVVFTADAVTNLLGRQSGRLKSMAPKAIVGAVQKIDAAATPIWLVAGENRVANEVVYSRMVATVTLGVEAKLVVRMESPDAEATGRSKETLEGYVAILRLAKEYRLAQNLGMSARVEITGTNATVTATITDKTLVAEYAKQK